MTRTLTIEIDEETDAVIRRQAAIEGCAPETLAARWINHHYAGRFRSMPERFPELACEAAGAGETEEELEQLVHDEVKTYRREKAATNQRS